MSDSAGWWAQRIAQERGHQPAPQQYIPPPPYQNPQQYPQVPPHIQQQQVPQSNAHALSEAEMISQARQGLIQPMDVLNAVGMKGGGKGTKTERDLCPECGSNHFFQRKALSKMGKAPAPYCHACGYNGMYEQYGTMDVPMTVER